MSDTFLRYLLLLQEIPHSPRQTDTATLARRLEESGVRVTRRTLQRDLEKLSRVLPLGCSDGTKPYGWSWKPGEGLPLPVLSASNGRARTAEGGTLSERALATLDSWMFVRDGRFESGLAPFIATHLADAVAAHSGLLTSELVVSLPLTPRSSGDVGFESSFALTSVDDHTAFLVRLRPQPTETSPPAPERDPELEAVALRALGRRGAQLRVVFVEPAPAPGQDRIGFDDLAFVVERHADDQSRCLARYLRRWAAFHRAPARQSPHGKLADIIPLAARTRLAGR